MEQMWKNSFSDFIPESFSKEIITSDKYIDLIYVFLKIYVSS